MAKDGDILSDVETDQLRSQLASQPEEGKAVMRLVAALEYKGGLSPAKIEAKYGWPQGTVYHWLEYFTERSIEDALGDNPRTGRPPKYSRK